MIEWPTCATAMKNSDTLREITDGIPETKSTICQLSGISNGYFEKAIPSLKIKPAKGTRKFVLAIPGIGARDPLFARRTTGLVRVCLSLTACLDSRRIIDFVTDLIKDRGCLGRRIFKSLFLDEKLSDTGVIIRLYVGDILFNPCSNKQICQAQKSDLPTLFFFYHVTRNKVFFFRPKQ